MVKIMAICSRLARGAGAGTVAMGGWAARISSITSAGVHALLPAGTNTLLKATEIESKC
jgi:hypothetical protein